MAKQTILIQLNDANPQDNMLYLQPIICHWCIRLAVSV